MLASERELPVSGGPGKRAYVREMFTAIAPTYDRLNRIISLRFDQRWRRYAVRRLGWAPIALAVLGWLFVITTAATSAGLLGLLRS